jgi:hypothetical protein
MIHRRMLTRWAGATALAAALGGAPALGEGLEWSGSARLRYESLDGQFRAGLSGGDHLLSSRTELRATWTLDALALAGEMVDARAWESDAGGALSTNEVDALELTEASARLGLGAVAIKAGRFTMDQGSRRLVARNAFRNSTNAFTGLRADWADGERRTASVFYVRPHVPEPTAREALRDNEAARNDPAQDLAFFGALAGLPFGAGVQLELYAFGLQEDDADGRATRNRHLLTPGLRLLRAPAAGTWDFEIEAAIQRGDARATTSPSDGADLDVRAGFAHLELGRSFGAPQKLRLSAEYDYGSGDADPGDGAYGRFDSLFGARRGDFGPTALYGPAARANLRSFGVRAEMVPTSRFDGWVALRWFELDEARDVFANTGVRDASGAAGRDAGRQIEARVRFWAVPQRLRLEAGGAYLDAGDFFARAPNATGEGDATYVHMDATVSF